MDCKLAMRRPAHPLWGPVQTERAQLSVAQGVVYVPVNEGHRVDAYDAATGTKLWQFTVDGGNDCCVSVARGAVFVATQSGSVYKIGGDGSTIAPVPTPTPLASPTEMATPSPSATPSPTGSPVAQFIWSSRGGASPLAGPGDLAIDPQGRLWVADTGNSRFAIFDPDGTFVEYWEHRGSGQGEFLLRRSNGDGYGAIAFAPDGSFYVLDVGNHRVEHFDSSRQFIKSWGSFGTGPGQFNDPIGLAVDGDGVIYVLDDIRDVVESYDTNGHVMGAIDAHPNRPGAFNSANNLALDQRGNFYISDCCSAGNQVQKLGPDGELLLTIGPAGPGTSHFGEQPGSMAVDSAGRLFVEVGPTIYIFDENGNVLARFTSPAVGPGDFFSGLLLDADRRRICRRSPRRPGREVPAIGAVYSSALTSISSITSRTPLTRPATSRTLSVSSMSSTTPPIAITPDALAMASSSA